MDIAILTLFPEMFPGPLGCSLAGEHLGTIWNLEAINIRDFATNKWHKVDDAPYGGGAGMVLQADVVHQALDYTFEKYRNKNPKIINMSPRGRKFDNSIAHELSSENALIFLCGRYEGIDQRVLDLWQEEHDMLDLSIGDFVLFGGEVAAMAMIESCIRFLPGMMHNSQSTSQESFELDLLEYPQYTKPAIWHEISVPSVLMSGNHQEIAKWRTEQSKQITKAIRPDIWARFESRSK